MVKVQIFCSYCHISYYRQKNRVNEAIKFGWKTFCSPKHLALSKLNSKEYICSYPVCLNRFKRTSSDLYKSSSLYCSRSCAASVNNKKFPKRPGIRKQCVFCDKMFISREKFCSRDCAIKHQTLSKDFLLHSIISFYRNNGRIPFKNESIHYTAIRKRFGSWNNAIEAAGFVPNPIKFSRKYKAKDGHICDSLAEKILDDWLYYKKMRHTRNIYYPSSKRLKVDFIVGDYWIEYFGLAGQHRRYDELKEKKTTIGSRL